MLRANPKTLIRNSIHLSLVCSLCLLGCAGDNGPDAKTSASPTPTPSSSNSTTGPEMVNLGRHVTTNWRSDDFSGASYREWSGDVDYFRFHFAQNAGAQIGLVGIMRGPNPNWGGRQIDALPDSLAMSVNARMDDLVGDQFTFGIYGWTHEQDASWTGNGWNNEFYVNFQGRPATAEPGRIFTNTIDVDGVLFDCYTYPHPPWMAPTQTQWVVESRTHTWNPNLNLAAVLRRLREQGLPNEHLMYLGWIVEALGGGVRGRLYLDQIVVPGIAP
ncbi:MAG: hypothetical protein JXO72_05685 [Vicinamibacteria bacterium]|nr:hypothetical protein [Vicinamibacteria bacterium]